MTSELQQQSQLADARLGVAEELGWVIAILAAAVVQLQWQNWLFTTPAGVVAYVLVVLRYRKQAATAEDRYFRAERLGKYAGTSTNDPV